ncbi:MAG TPA: L,D-transpeptidase [Ktedonobacterales bacterium]
MHDWLKAAGQPRRVGRGGLPRLLPALGVALLLLTMLLSACAPSPQDSARQNKSRLDTEIATARTKYSVPDLLLAPIRQQEQTLAASAHGSDNAYTTAATGYSRLYNQVVALEHASPQQAQTAVQTDLKQYNTVLAAVQKQGYIEAGQYAQNMQKAQQQYANASTTAQLFQYARYIEAQTVALNAIDPTYQQLKALNAQIDAQAQALGLDNAAVAQPLDCATEDNYSPFFTPDTAVMVTPPNAQPALPKYQFQQWPEQDLALFRAASSADQYNALVALIKAQSTQLAADTTALGPQEAARLVNLFKTDVQTYQADGGTDASFAQQAAQDAQTLAAAKTPSDFAKLVQTVQKQRQTIELPLTKAQVNHDMQTLQALVAKGHSIQIHDTAPGFEGYYPLDYEYATDNNNGGGILDLIDWRLPYAQTLSDYQAVDEEIQMFITNLTAMIQDNSDTTSWNKPHLTDITLMEHYGIYNTKVVVVSLAGQTARMYDNGKLVHADFVTTGAPDLPSPPGIHCVMSMQSPFTMKSPYPKSDPRYYNPTPVQYAMLYSNYGYFMHDAWWRDQQTGFGPGSNLPHYDPIAFNNGSHGCINFPSVDAAWLYNWVDIGTPVLVY